MSDRPEGAPGDRPDVAGGASTGGLGAVSLGGRVDQTRPAGDAQPGSSAVPPAGAEPGSGRTHWTSAETSGVRSSTTETSGAGSTSTGTSAGPTGATASGATASGATRVTGPAGPASDATKSVGQLFKEITAGLSNLVRKEIQLAQQELGGQVAVKAKGAAIIAIAAVFGFFALIFLLLALRDGLDTFLWRWVADLITALLLLAIGGVAALVARRKLAQPISADLTKKTIKDDVEWAKQLGKQ
jgi:uncharacterized membrane protein YqjE